MSTTVPFHSSAPRAESRTALYTSVAHTGDSLVFVITTALQGAQNYIEGIWGNPLAPGQGIYTSQYYIHGGPFLI